MDITKAEIEQKLISLREDDLSKTILVPLFSSIYNANTEFVGGREEKGRDILIYIEDPIDGVNPIAVQVKKIKPTSNSQQASFQQLITQLHQAKSELVIDPISKNKIKTSKLFFVTPYILHQRVMDTHHGAMLEAGLDDITIIDGARLSRLLLQHTPELLKLIMKDEDILRSFINPKLTNEYLMKALNLGNVRGVLDIYCEIDFSFGGTDSIFQEGLVVKCEKNQHTVAVDIDELIKIEEDIKLSKTKIDCSFIENESFQDAISRVRSRDALKEQLNERRGRLQSQIELYQDLLPKYYYYTHIDFKDLSLDDLVEEFTGTLKHTNQKLNRDMEFSQLCKDLVNNFQNIKVNKKEIDRIQKEMLNTHYTLQVNIDAIAKGVNLLNKKIFSISEENLNIEEYFTCIDQISLWISWYRRYKGEFSIKPGLISPIKKPPVTLLQVLNSKRNIVLLGEAGSGKTTSLQFFAKKLYQSGDDGVVVYCTLYELCDLDKGIHGKCLIKLLSIYLRKAGVKKGEMELKNCLKSQKFTLILDSVDEAYVSFSWVVDALDKLSKYMRNGRVITSSRNSIKEVFDLNFTHISLRPFNDAQKELFFDKWFNDCELKKQVMEHLRETPKLNEVVTNPLSATILATLKDHEIPLPTTEASLYQKRFELLSGLFDRFKGVNRSSIRPELLLESAEYLAFELHLKNRRKIDKSEAVVSLKESSINFGNIEPSNVVRELMSPCEIFLPDDKGMLSFGHLRFQEFLASSELDKRKSLNLHRLLKNKWWHDVFYLYSQTARDITWLIDDAIINNYTLDVKDLFDRLVPLRKGAEKQVIQNRINSALDIEVAERRRSLDDDDFSYHFESDDAF